MGVTQEPAQQGAGLGLQEQSVKVTTVLLSQFSNIDCDLALDEPKRSQYSGILQEG